MSKEKKVIKKLNQVLEVLSKERLTFSQQDKLIKLVKRECETASTASDKTESNKEYKSPLYLYRFLHEYNQDPVLKYTCHLIDDDEIIEEIKKECGTSDYDFNSHQKLIYKSFKKLAEKNSINEKVYKLIENYLNGGTWSSDKITEGWNSEGIRKWSEQNPGKIPNPGENIMHKYKNPGYKLQKSFKSKILWGKITNFSHLVLHFKHLFHIREDNSLINIVKRINSEEFESKVDFKYPNFIENIELFTDVDKLMQAYKKIIWMCIKENKIGNPKIELSFFRENSQVKFSIHHKNSTYHKTCYDQQRRIGKDLDQLIKNQINGLCDFYLEADFGKNNFKRINLWDGNVRTCVSIDKMKGVKFLLVFKTE